jgi:hypothetical protein
MKFLVCVFVLLCFTVMFYESWWFMNVSVLNTFVPMASLSTFFLGVGIFVASFILLVGDWIIIEARPSV